MAKSVLSYRTAATFLPERARSLSALRAAAATCEGCPLFARATQTVFGEGARGARLVLVGEQPGNQEDLTGHPFVGPAGRLLDEVLVEAGIDRGKVYVTNAVKHFKWEERGRRRLHAKPSAREVQACRPWLEAEFKTIEPEAIVCLGATAARSLLGAAFRITKQRGKFLRCDWAPWLMATYHPSAVLRAPDEERRHAMRRQMTADLRGILKKVPKIAARH